MKRKRNKVHEPYNNLKGWLRGNSLKYEDIAELLGIRIGTVSDKINGLSDFHLYEVEKIVSKYGTSYNIFFN
ncbi:MULTISPECIES: helix-turn-helix domain-containing protein [Clostridium]|uniref:HTH cro/C1-type domain-containing protein n=1 Tax=Clostridium frigoriphilum TaxID=443253 RepID=A0ABU7UHZ8_9CLOT|nr:hypothetical protein [Clostridium sp. DSM 17811]MBU3098347.1 hypothetical protein [Clostridium sp. DSM 17811]